MELYSEVIRITFSDNQSYEVCSGTGAQTGAQTGGLGHSLPRPYSRVGKASPALGLVNFRCKVVSTSLTLSSYQVL